MAATKPNPQPATQHGRVPVSSRIIIAGTGAEETPVWQNNLGHKVKVREAKYIPEDDVTGNDTNNFLLAVNNRGTDGAGAVVPVPAKEYDTGTDMGQFESDDLPVSATEASLEVDVDEILTLAKTVTGSGLALPDGVLFLELEYV
jgi:hypothetical protein